MLGIEVLRRMQYGMQILKIAERQEIAMGWGRRHNPLLVLAACLLFAWIAPTRAGTPPLPVIPTNQFFITNFGAVGNGISNSASAIQKAITAAAGAGGGTVVVAAVGVLTNYLSGPINLTNSVCLQINSGTKLQMLPKSLWPSTAIPFINGTNLHDVVISGSGTIDGQERVGGRAEEHATVSVEHQRDHPPANPKCHGTKNSPMYHFAR